MFIVLTVLIVSGHMLLTKIIDFIYIIYMSFMNHNFIIVKLLRKRPIDRQINR